MKKIIFIAIILLGIFLRFVVLSTNPPSLDWDEASLGYNAYSILKTGSDEYGNKLPLSIRSFDDYKPPLYVYLDIPFVALLGLSELAVRMPSAIAGSLLVIVTFYLVTELLKDSSFEKRQFKSIKISDAIALTASLFVAISPWSLQFSRAAFEGNIGILFLSLGILMILKGFSKSRCFLLASLAFALSLYSYHSFRLVVPIILGIIALVWWKQLIKEKVMVLASGVLFILLILPIFVNFFFASQGSSSRLSMVTSFGASSVLDHSISELEYDQKHNDMLGAVFHNRRAVFAMQTIKGYLDHWNPEFLFLKGDGGVQHHAVEMGMLYLWDLPFILIGIFLLWKHVTRRIVILFIWFLAAPLASAITTGTPHPVRAIAMIPPFHIMAAVGFIMMCTYLLSNRRYILVYRTLVAGVIFLFFINVTYYFHQYYVHTPIEYGYFWQYGYKDALKTAQSQENNYNKIIVTYEYDQPYIYYLFYNKIDPSWYQKNWDYNKNGMLDRFKRVIGKYEFRDINWTEDKNLKNTLFIGTPQEIPESAKEKIQEVRFLDNSAAFIIAGT